jgi:hypothetical protein
VLFRGPYLTQAVWSRLAVEAGFGEIVWIERASKERLAGYVTKALPGYVTKGLADRTPFPRHYRRVRFSRGWAPAWIVRARRAQTDGPSPWELVRPGTWKMSAYLRVLTVGSRAEPGGWALKGTGEGP